ncbi:MAG TPA: hypothetical protein ENH87_00345 [Pricia antarctica]|uniref:Uncharacterized protein n=1 Tax=Pricia antarctica TaxID=641691 RepID=A0A831QMG6_9FLAO|nr:hypothetical protein [Pricia antarctica]
MKHITKISIAAIILISYQNVLGQKDRIQNPDTNIYQTIANSELDLVIRINNNMNDEELKSRIDILHLIDEDIVIDYSRDKSGKIKTLSSSGVGSSCLSENFDFLIISLKNNKWAGCMISDNK